MHFSVAHVECFKKINREPSAAPQLAHSNLEEPFTLYTDEFKIAVGAVLLQSNANGVEGAISFFSKTLSQARRNYSTFVRECLAMI